MVWLILPTYEEAGNVERVVRAALAALERAAPGSHRILVVDDDSPDGTGRIADALAAELPAVEVLHRTEREGLGPAYLAGFDVALRGGAELVLEMDADLSHDPADIERLVDRRAGRRPRARLALRARRPGARLGPRAPRDQPPRRLVRRGRPRPAHQGPDRRLQVLPPRGAGGDRPRRGALPRLRLPDRAHVPRLPGRASAWSRSRSRSATARRGARRCPGGSRWRPSCSCPGCGGGAAAARSACRCARCRTCADRAAPRGPCGR